MKSSKHGTVLGGLLSRSTALPFFWGGGGGREGERDGRERGREGEVEEGGREGERWEREGGREVGER